MRFIPSTHLKQQAAAKGISPAAVDAAAHSPDITYESHQHPGQWKHISIEHGIAVVVNYERRTIVTVYRHKVETPLREDQRADAHA